MRRVTFAGLVLALAFTLIFAACGGNNSATSPTQNAQQGQMFVNMSDAPLGSVLDFQITVNSMTVTDGTNTATLVSTPTNIEVTRLLGLRTLLGLNAVAPGTYNSATVTVSSPVITYLDTTTNPATIKTMNGTFGSGPTFTFTIKPGLVIDSAGAGGLHLHFDLSKSLQTDSNGNFTGVVNPAFTLRGLDAPTDPDWEIDEFLGTATSVNAVANSFVFTRPDGRTFTIDTNGTTIWDGSGVTGINNLPTNAVVDISGGVQADGSILADMVQVLSLTNSYMGGLVLDVNPTSGAASNLTVLIREEIPTQSTIPIYQPAQINLSSTTNYHVRYLPWDISHWIFNDHSIVTGQRIGLAGAVDSTNSAQFDAARVTLRWQGHDGLVVPGSVNTTNGTFTFDANGLLGYVLPSSGVTVYTFPGTQWLGGLTSISDLANLPANTQIRVVGLILKDPASGAPVLIAIRVVEL